MKQPTFSRDNGITGPMHKILENCAQHFWGIRT